jgi:SAM-dependent methyltransferase
MIFQDYANYYDLLYKDKSYDTECDYIVGLLNKYSKKEVKTVLDLGSGTGNHDAILSKKGYNVTGVDQSERMIAVAKSKQNDSLKFYLGDARDVDLKKKYDAVISLFHVASYQTSNDDLVSYFRTIKKHVDDGGIFIYDFWYGPGVLTDKPTVRVKRLSNNELTLLRIAEPTLVSTSNVVNINYEMAIEKKSTKERFVINEEHSMRYLFIPELVFYMKTAGLIKDESSVVFEEWMTGEVQTERSWYVVCIGKSA